MVDEDDELVPSRGDLRDADKAETKRARAVVDRLLSIPAEEARELPLDDAVSRSLAEWHRIRGKARTGRQRLKHRMVTEVRLTNLVELEAALGMGDAVRSAKDDAMMALEAWRDRLLADGDDAIDAFVEVYAVADRHRLRQLVRQAVRDGGRGKAYRELFGVLRDATGW